MIKIIQRSLLLLIIIFAFSCGTKRQLTKTFYGKSLSEVKEKYGEPKTVFDRDSEKIYVFEKVTKLESTQINQGKLTLDPIITPKVKKKERFYFTVVDDKVVKARMEEEYER